MRNLFKKIFKSLDESLYGKRYPISYQAVDIVVINIETRQILLGSKWEDEERTKAKGEKRFIGGFVDPSDPSLEYAARRELSEEAGHGLEVGVPSYVGSFRVDDPRYRESEHKIMSAVFVTKYIFGRAKAGDDIAKVHWVDIDFLKINYEQVGHLAPEHKPLVKMLIDKAYI
jgi:ADP-ribose pyrophosphatase YjhB (NUDIX family)